MWLVKNLTRLFIRFFLLSGLDNLTSLLALFTPIWLLVVSSMALEFLARSFYFLCLGFKVDMHGPFITLSSSETFMPTVCSLFCRPI